MAGRPEKTLEPDGSARTDLAIRMRLAKGNVTLKEIAAKTNYSMGYLQQVFSGTTAPSRPAIEACLRALEQDLSAWEPYIAAALTGGAAIPEAVTSQDLSVDDSGSIDDSSQLHLHEPSPGVPVRTATSDAVEAQSAHAGRSSTDSRPDADSHGRAAPDVAAPSATDTEAERTDGESQNAARSRPGRGLLVGAVAAATLIVAVIVVVAVTRSGSTTNSEATEGTPSPALVSVQEASSAGAADPADTRAVVTFDALGASGTQVIQVYAGPGGTPEDREVTGTYMSGMTAPVTCQAQGRTIRSDTAAGEPDRAFDIWLRIDAPGPPQFATLTYTSLEPANLAKLPTCQ